MREIITSLSVLVACASAYAQTIHGQLVTWHPITITFEGPQAAESDNSPNPFLDYRLQVVFSGPDSQLFVVPGFFDGDGQGGSNGNCWRVRFAPNVPGKWGYKGSFRQGSNVAIDLALDAGKPLNLEKLDGQFTVASVNSTAAGFLKWGRLEYVGRHYLKFHDGPYWLRGGTDEPENLLAYAGFTHTPPKHSFADHEADWREGDPDWGSGRGRALIGALNYLADHHVNSVYFLTMNIGGDGKDVWPWSGSINPKGSPDNDNLHFDVAKLDQWNTAFQHAQRRGIFLHVVFNEAEEANKRELDDGELGPERKLYYREMIARFGHHLALEWNICEEYNLNFDLGEDRVRAFADFIRALDPYDHPITVHSAGDPLKELRFTFGDSRFSLTSVQLNQRPIHEFTEAIRAATCEAGRPLPVSLDEFTLDRGQRASHIPVDEAAGHRREKIWPTYFSGGMIEIILDDLLRTDSFKKGQREEIWRYLWFARRFMEENLRFWEMEPADELAAGGGTIAVGVGNGDSVPLGPQVLAKRGRVYAIYLPIAMPTITLDLTEMKGAGRQRWYNPRTGELFAKSRDVSGGAIHTIGQPPGEADADWVVLIERTDAKPLMAIDTKAFADCTNHWRRFRDPKRVIHVLPGQASYAPDQVEEIAANILLYQRANGGWPKDYDMQAMLTPKQKAAIEATRENNDTSFDNYNIHSQVNYLAKAYAAGGDTQWRAACERGFDFMIAAQLPNGGFPQEYPETTTDFANCITFNDGVTTGILNVFQDVAENQPQWKWLDDDRRRAAKTAVRRGTDCILQCQIRFDGKRKGWCQQHDPKTFAAASARSFELASICPQETTANVRFLMRIESPEKQVVDAIDEALSWLRRTQLEGIRVQRFPAVEVAYEFHTRDFDVVVLEESDAPPIWARHYEIETDRPIFSGRDSIKRYSLHEIERERRTGTPWYGNWPRELLEKLYPAWRSKHSKRHGNPLRTPSSR